MRQYEKTHLENLEALLKEAERIPAEKRPHSWRSPDGKQRGITIYMNTMYGQRYELELKLFEHKGEVVVYQNKKPITTYTIQEQEKTFLGIPYTVHSLSVREESTGQETAHYQQRITGAIYRRLCSCMRLTIEHEQSSAQQRIIPSLSAKQIINQLLAAPWQGR
jgi:hypothetical protein